MLNVGRVFHVWLNLTRCLLSLSLDQFKQPRVPLFSHKFLSLKPAQNGITDLINVICALSELLVGNLFENLRPGGLVLLKSKEFPALENEQTACLSVALHACCVLAAIAMEDVIFAKHGATLE